MKDLVYYKKNKFNLEKETIVFLHGLTGHSEVWKDYYAHFKKSYNVLLIDLIGNGKSGRPFAFSKYSLRYLAQSVIEIIKKEKIKNAHFVAHSYSFLVMLELNEINKNLCLSCTFISPYYPNRDKLLWKIEMIIIIPVSFICSLFIPIKKDYVIKYDKNELWEKFNTKRFFSDIWKNGIKSYIALNYYSLKYNHPERISNIHSPVLIITGKEDGIVHLEEVKSIHKKINNSKLVILKERSHILVYPFSHELVPIIDKFLKKVKHGSR